LAAAAAAQVLLVLLEVITLRAMAARVLQVLFQEPLLRMLVEVLAGQVMQTPE
jgi:hypothetical protein